MGREEMRGSQDFTVLQRHVPMSSIVQAMQEILGCICNAGGRINVQNAVCLIRDFVWSFSGARLNLWYFHPLGTASIPRAERKAPHHLHLQQCIWINFKQTS